MTTPYDDTPDNDAPHDETPHDDTEPRIRAIPVALSWPDTGDTVIAAKPSAGDGDVAEEGRRRELGRPQRIGLQHSLLQPGVSQPGVVQPDLLQPAVLQPVAAEFVMTESVMAENGVAAVCYRIGTSAEAVVVRGAVRFGRRPATSRIPSAVATTLVSVPSPRGEISANHLEIRAAGTAVMVTDLKSSNGSAVRLPGQISRTLRGGESVVVPAGTAVDLGEGVVIHILSVPSPLLPKGTE